MTRRDLLLRGLLVGVAAFHLAVGIGLNLNTDDFVPFMADLYGAQVETWSPQFLYAMRPLGGFMLALGLIAAAAVWRPRELRPVIYAFVVLFVLRALHRVLYDGRITELFGISTGRNLMNMAFFFGLAAALVAADLWAQSGRAPSARGD